MPVEIRELVIRAEVRSDQQTNTTDQDNGNAAASSSGLSTRDKRLLIEECVAQVLRTLEQQKER